MVLRASVPVSGGGRPGFCAWRGHAELGARRVMRPGLALAGLVARGWVHEVLQVFEVEAASAPPGDGGVGWQVGVAEDG